MSLFEILARIEILLTLPRIYPLSGFILSILGFCGLAPLNSNGSNVKGQTFGKDRSSGERSNSTPFFVALARARRSAAFIHTIGMCRRAASNDLFSLRCVAL